MDNVTKALHNALVGTAVATVLATGSLGLSIGPAGAATTPAGTYPAAAAKPAVTPHDDQGTVGNANGNPEAYCNFLSGDHTGLFPKENDTEAWNGPFLMAGTGITQTFASDLLANDNMIRSAFNSEGLYNDTADGETGSPLPMLSTNTALTTEAQDWADCEASAYFTSGGGIFDNPDLIQDAESAGYPSSYESENTQQAGGQGEGTANYTESFLSDSAHYPQIVNPDASQIGIGVACDNLSWMDPGQIGSQPDNVVCIDVEDFSIPTLAAPCEPGYSGCANGQVPRITAGSENETWCGALNPSSPCFNFKNDLFNEVAAQFPGGLSGAATEVSSTGGAGVCKFTFDTATQYGDSITGYTWWNGNALDESSVVTTTDFTNDTSTGKTTVTFHVPFTGSFSGQIVALNDLGPGELASQSNSCTVTSTTANTVPTAPTSVKATGTSTGISASWKAPTSDGGSALTGYLVTVATGDASNGYSIVSDYSVPASQTSLSIPGQADFPNMPACNLVQYALYAGCSYVVSVQAENSLGYGVGVPWSSQVTSGQTNGGPSCSEYTASTPYETSLTVDAPGLLSTCSGTDLTVTATTQPANGTVTTESDGAFEYTPNAGFTGTDSFTYTVTDSNSNTATGTAVITVEKVPTTTTVTPSTTKAVYGEPVSFRVSAMSGTMPMTGTVSVSGGVLGACTATLTEGSGTCSIRTRPKALKDPVWYGLTASYHGTDPFGSSSAKTKVRVSRAGTTTKITAKPDRTRVGKKVTYAVTVSAAYTTPTGTVEVERGGVLLCTIRLSKGAGSCSTTKTAKGSDTITAEYESTTDYLASKGTAKVTVT